MRSVSIAGAMARKNTFPAREMHRNYYKIQDAINTVEEISARTGCSVETIKREKRRLFQVSGSRLFREKKGVKYGIS